MQATERRMCIRRASWSRRGARATIIRLRERRGKAYFSSGLWTAEHEERMGNAIWLFGWLVDRQTKRSGLVLGGKELNIETIAHYSRYPARSVRRWLAALKAEGYVNVKYTNYKRMKIWIVNPKKFAWRQAQLGLKNSPEPSAKYGRFKTANSGRSMRPKVADSTIEKSKVLRKRETANMQNPLPPEEAAELIRQAREQLAGILGSKAMPEVCVEEPMPVEMSEREFRERYGLVEKEPVPA